MVDFGPVVKWWTEKGLFMVRNVQILKIQMFGFRVCTVHNKFSIWVPVKFKIFNFIFCSIFVCSDCELGPIVNRDLSRRIRTVTGLTVDKKVCRNDIRLAAKVITNLDKRWGIWSKDNPEGEEIKKVSQKFKLKKKFD